MRLFVRTAVSLLVFLLASERLCSQGAAAGTNAVAPPNPMQRAGTLLNSGRAAEAVPLLDSITAARPELAQGWALLGAALLVTRQLDRAVSILERATTTPATRPAALYNLGLALALQGKMDTAFAVLHAAKATALIDMTQLGFDTDAGPVRAHSRYRELMPSEAEFAAPFVESVPILQEWRGDAPGDQFGWVARDVGDVDGDGKHDIVTSAPTSANNSGAVYLLSTRNTSRLWTVRGAAGDQLGTGVEAAGDVNADGVPDVIAGAPGGGYVLLLSGRDGSVLRRLNSRVAGEGFGQKVNDLGDVDGDGHADVLVGAPRSDVAATDAGRVYIISGKTGADIAVLDGESAGDLFGSSLGGEVRAGVPMIVVGASGVAGGGRTYVYRGLAPKASFTIDADSTSVALGAMFVSVVGDVDKDGTSDVYASDWNSRAKGSTTGRVFVHSGATGARLHTLTGEGPGDGFGIGVADAGDVDGDGHDDMVIGSWQYRAVAPAGGKVYVYSGRDGSLLGSITGKVMGETLGFDATGIGDLDGDGRADLLLTSAWSAVQGTRSGRVLIVSGAAVIKKP